jgi:hypothetical protein
VARLKKEGHGATRLPSASRSDARRYTEYWSDRDPPVDIDIEGLFERSCHMPERVTVDIAGGCPKYGNPALIVPEDYAPDTIVTSPKCNYSARWEEVFGEDDATYNS